MRLGYLAPARLPLLLGRCALGSASSIMLRVKISQLNIDLSKVNPNPLTSLQLS